MRRSVWMIAATLAAAGCQQKPAPPAPLAPVAAAASPAAPPPAEDRTPVSEAPFTATSAQGAADVVQTYFALVEEKRFGQAWRLWSDGGQAAAPSAQDFSARFAGYADYHALIDAPGQIEGAAGSLYVEVPITVYGKRTSGGDFKQTGTVTLRRVNDVPGSTAEQRLWRIAKIDLAPGG
ncbi:MAG: hypothetical protein JWM33_164 [Caulobacteraceae bacterium]|nr:hypothetical protein [Caulobacteraceae bacterium]